MELFTYALHPRRKPLPPARVSRQAPGKSSGAGQSLSSLPTALVNLDGGGNHDMLEPSGHWSGKSTSQESEKRGG